MLRLFLNREYCKLDYTQIACKDAEWTVHNELTNEDIDEIYNMIKTKIIPLKRMTLQKFCKRIKTQERLSRQQLEYLRKELAARKDKLQEKTNNKLQKMYDKLNRINATEKEIEKEFLDVSFEIGKYTQCSKSQIDRAIFKLYDDLNYYYPMTDWNNDYLSVNSGRKIKDILIYGDGENFKAIVIRSLRMLEEEEIEKEIC